MNETRYHLVKLRDVRERREVSQAELAELAQVARSTIVRLERGTHAANGMTANRLARALGTERDVLTGEAQDRKDAAPIVTQGRIGRRSKGIPATSATSPTA